jgi:hypothetical protein
MVPGLFVNNALEELTPPDGSQTSSAPMQRVLPYMLPYTGYAMVHSCMEENAWLTDRS